MDRFGRRMTVLIGAAINLLGAALQTGAQNLAMILVGRILAGWAVGLMSMSVPIYQSECAHPRNRGMYDLFVFVYNSPNQGDRIYCGSHPTNDWCWLHCLYMGRLWRLQNV